MIEKLERAIGGAVLCLVGTMGAVALFVWLSHVADEWVRRENTRT